MTPSLSFPRISFARSGKKGGVSERAMFSSRGYCFPLRALLRPYCALSLSLSRGKRISSSLLLCRCISFSLSRDIFLFTLFLRSLSLVFAFSSLRVPHAPLFFSIFGFTLESRRRKKERERKTGTFVLYDFRLFSGCVFPRRFFHP